jgi:hypothetical protein
MWNDRSKDQRLPMCLPAENLIILTLPLLSSNTFISECEDACTRIYALGF